MCRGRRCRRRRAPAGARRPPRADAPRGRPGGAADAGRRRAPPPPPPTPPLARRRRRRRCRRRAGAANAGRRRRAVGDVRSALGEGVGVVEVVQLVVARVDGLDDRRRRRAARRGGRRAEAPLPGLERSRVAGCAQRSAKRRAGTRQRVLASARGSASACPVAALLVGGGGGAAAARRRGLVGPHRVPRDRVLIAPACHHGGEPAASRCCCFASTTRAHQRWRRAAARPGARSACRRARSRGAEARRRRAT